MFLPYLLRICCTSPAWVAAISDVNSNDSVIFHGCAVFSGTAALRVTMKVLPWSGSEEHRRKSATRKGWSEGSESCDEFMKFGMSSSGCETRPAKG